MVGNGSNKGCGDVPVVIGSHETAQDSSKCKLTCKIIEIIVLNMKEWFEGLESVLVEYKW